MKKIKAGRSILVVLDEAGRIVATAPAGAAPSNEAGGSEEDEEPVVSIAALPGQMVVEVALPRELERLVDGPPDDLYEALAAYSLRSGPARGVLVPVAAPPKKGS